MRKQVIYSSVAFAVVFVLHAAYSIWENASISRQWVQVEETNLLPYFEQQDYLLGFSYALASAFTIYAFCKFLERRRGGIAGLLGGVTLTGILYGGGCFLLGCCGSPLLIVYLSLFGSSFLKFVKPLVLIMTTISVVTGYFWIQKKTALPNSCCTGSEGEAC